MMTFMKKLALMGAAALLTMQVSAAAVSGNEFYLIMPDAPTAAKATLSFKWTADDGSKKVLAGPTLENLSAGVYKIVGDRSWANFQWGYTVNTGVSPNINWQSSMSEFDLKRKSRNFIQLNYREFPGIDWCIADKSHITEEEKLAAVVLSIEVDLAAAGGAGEVAPQALTPILFRDFFKPF